MTLEARVKTVDAMEPFDFLDCWAFVCRFSWPSFPPAPKLYSLRFLRIKNHQTRATMMVTKAIPPMTPPAMAPGPPPPPEESSWEPEPLPDEVLMHLVVAHWLQDWLIMVQVEPFSQAGHDGAEVSHLTQRLKMDRAVKAGWSC